MTRELSTQSRLTTEQAEALVVGVGSVALSAGAGCGKTTVLTERFVRALDGPSPTPLGRLVALTFTNKAARELRDRIRRECRLKVAAGHDPTYWRGVVRGLEAARIGTFHSFCGEVLRRHAIEAGIDPGFVVLDEPVAGALRDEALAVALREALAHRDRDLIELAVDFGLGAVRQALGSLLNNRSGGDIALWTAKEPRDLVAHWLDRWTRDVRPALVARVRLACAPCLDLIAATSFDNPKVQARLADFAAAVARLDDVGMGDPVPAIKGVQEAAKVVGLVGKLWPSPEVYEAIKDGFETIRETSKKVANGLVWDEATSTAAAVHGIRFARLATRARTTYDRMKRLRGGVDNDDLLLLTRDLVAGESPVVREALSESADLILVDEFQDTDPIQGEILSRMVGSDAAAVDGRLFLVGDFKQSIYRFRGADPALFRQFRAAVPEAGRRNLTENFRSVPGILGFVNALFGDTFTEAGSALKPGGAIEDQGGPLAVLFSWDAPPIAPPSGKPGKPDAIARRNDEARRLARYLADRLKRGWPIRDPITRTSRPAHAGDVAILFRTLADSGTYESALVAEGLDFHVVGGSGFFAQLEVLDLINVLSAVEDPTDSVALAGALRSPFFSVSDDALFWLAIECPGALHQGLAKLAEERASRLPEADRPRVERAGRLLTAWRSAKDAVPIASLVDRILSESGYEAALLGEFLGDRKRANARKLVRMARRLDDAGGFILADFVERLRSDLRAATKETQAATTDDGGEIVRLMSIHQSKGLEFPIVVVPDLDRKRPHKLDRVAFHPDLGPLVNPVADADDGSEDDAVDPGGSLGWTVYRHVEEQADTEEALRLFYVATTRARDFLILSAATDPTRSAGSPALSLLDRRFNRETGSIKVPLPDGWVAPQVEVIAPEPAAPTEVRTRASIRSTPLLEVAEMIRGAQLRPVLAPERREIRPLPRWVGLDPTLGLSSTGARLDRLCRSILLDPRVLDPAATPAIAQRAAILQDSVAGPALIERAITQVRGWLNRLPGAMAHEECQRGGRSDWTVPWPPVEPSTVFAGWSDLRFCHPDGSVDLVLVGPDTITPGEALRSILSARASGKRVSRVWWLSWNPGVEPTAFDRFDDIATRLAIELWAESNSKSATDGHG